jgi:hypothetical protein
MIVQIIRVGFTRKRGYLMFCLLLSCGIASANLSIAADKLQITDEYLQGLSDEISSPEYLDQAKEELRKTETAEETQAKPTTQLTQAMVDIDSFETLLKTEFPASYKIYSELPGKSRVSVFTRFNTTKKLSSAKRLIIDLYLSL